MNSEADLSDHAVLSGDLPPAMTKREPVPVVWLHRSLTHPHFHAGIHYEKRDGWEHVPLVAVERAAEACRALLDEKEEARALQASYAAKGKGDELDRLRHWATVSTFNAGIRCCIAAVMGCEALPPG